MTHIYSRLTDQVLSAIVVPALACSNRNTVRLNVAFDSAWDGLTKSAVFYTSTNPMVYEVPINGADYCIVPEEVLVESGRLFISIKGIDTSTGKRKASTLLNLKILPGTPVQVVSDPTGSIYEKLLSAYGLAADEIAVERSRISNILALKDGSTTGDAELQDARIDANAKTHVSAGDAARAWQNTIRGIMQNGGAENPLQPLMFNQRLAYKGGTSYKYENLSEPFYTVGDIAYYNSIEQTDGTNYVIGGKLVSPIPVTSDTVDKYHMIVESDEDFEAYVIISSQGNWGANAVRLHSESFKIKKGFNIIPLVLKDATNEGATADYYHYVLFRSYKAFTANFSAYIVHGGGVLGWLMENCKPNDEYVTCWGDSLTAQAGWTETLQELCGMTVYNGGTGGESVRTITARQGADVIMINNITIPAAVQAVTVATYANPFKTAFGHNATPLLQGGAHVNPVKIGNVEGTLKWTGNSYNDASGTWTFTRSEAGEKVVIDRPTAMTTAFDREKNSPHLMVIFMGQNGGYGSDNDELVRLHRLMIDHAKAKHTVILGLSSGSADSRAEYESAMKKAFGRYFISLREYLSQYGLADAGLTPTTADTEAMASGTVPPQLLSDNVHFTSATRTVIGKMLYKRCCELGIFEE